MIDNKNSVIENISLDSHWFISWRTKERNESTMMGRLFSSIIKFALWSTILSMEKIPLFETNCVFILVKYSVCSFIMNILRKKKTNGMERIRERRKHKQAILSFFQSATFQGFKTFRSFFDPPSGYFVLTQQIQYRGRNNSDTKLYTMEIFPRQISNGENVSLAKRNPESLKNVPSWRKSRFWVSKVKP